MPIAFRVDEAAREMTRPQCYCGSKSAHDIERVGSANYQLTSDSIKIVTLRGYCDFNSKYRCGELILSRAKWQEDTKPVSLSMNLTRFKPDICIR